MLAHLIYKEILDQILSLRFLILAGIGAMVVWLSLLSGYGYYQHSLNDYGLAQVASQKRIQEIDESENYSEFVVQGYLEHKPPTSLSIFVRGLDPVLGRSIPNTFTRRMIRSRVEVKPLLAVFQSMDLGLVIQVVLSLFVLLMTYDSVCGEKERGTPSWITSHPVPKHRLILGKFLGALIPTLSAFGLPLLLGIAVFLLLPDVQFSDSEFSRLVFILVSCGIYLTVFVCIGLLASCLTHRSSISFVILFGFWVMTVVVLPRVGLIAADSFLPAPSYHELEAEKEAVSKAGTQRWRDARQQWSDVYKESNGEDWWRS